MIEDFYNYGVYSLDKEEKRKKLTNELLELTEYHRKNCKAYANILHGLRYDPKNVKTPADIPFFPVRMFKQMDLISIPYENVFKIMTSSGTTGQSKSKIFVDRETSMIQQKVLLKIIEENIGEKKRIPIMIIDAPSILKDRKNFTARGAAIIGLEIMAKKMTFVLNEDMTLNENAVVDFLSKYGSDKFLIFGFTFMVWQYLYQYSVENGLSLDLSNGFLMTGGGWKKLQSSASQEEFQDKMTNQFGIKRFLDHYAMVEQTGCIYLECECHHLHASIYSDVFVRNPDDFSLCKNGEEGIIQTVSILPHSYPGHSVLTEDRGIILGEDDCPCGRKGKYIKILSRIKEAEMRGCSDTYNTN